MEGWISVELSRLQTARVAQWCARPEDPSLCVVLCVWQGAVALAKSLKASGAPVLKELHIWSNHIGDVGRIAFEEALSKH